MNYDDKCQILIIGNSVVGKTSILTKYTTKTYNENYIATVGLDFFTKDEKIDDKTIRVKIWDTAGQERYKAITKCFFQRAQGIIIVFDVNNKKSFDKIYYYKIIKDDKNNDCIYIYIPKMINVSFNNEKKMKITIR